MKSSNAMRPSPRSHASNIVDGVRQCATAVDRGRLRLTAWVWMLLKSVNARFLIPYHPPRSNAAEGYGQHSNAVDPWWRLNACERVQRRQWECCINLGLLTITYGRAFWDCISYHIAIFCAVSYRIHRFPPQPYRAITNSYHSHNFLVVCFGNKPESYRVDGLGLLFSMSNSYLIPLMWLLHWLLQLPGPSFSRREYKGADKMDRHNCTFHLGTHDM